MSPFNQLYNWMARRRIGQWLGVTWDPNRDSAHQRQLDPDRACMTELMQRTRLVLAEQALADGRSEEAAEMARVALASLQEIADTGMPGVPELITRARRILAVFPLETPLPQQTPFLSVEEMRATFGAICALLNAGRLAEARRSWTSAMRSQIVDDSKIKDEFRRAMATLDMALTEAEQRSKPDETASGEI
jgi:hypothetical protein